MLLSKIFNKVKNIADKVPQIINEVKSTIEKIEPEIKHMLESINKIAAMPTANAEGANDASDFPGDLWHTDVRTEAQAKGLVISKNPFADKMPIHTGHVGGVIGGEEESPMSLWQDTEFRDAAVSKGLVISKNPFADKMPIHTGHVGGVIGGEEESPMSLWQDTEFRDAAVEKGLLICTNPFQDDYALVVHNETISDAQ